MDLNDNRHLLLVRHAEIEAVRRWLTPGTRVLEIGGGNGYQAGIIASWGCEVHSIDVSQALDHMKGYYPVGEYDGERIPFPQESFDTVFSSNVLEHVERLPDMLLEIGEY